MRAAQDVLKRLQRSSFRRRFRLGGMEREYARERGPDRIRTHAEAFVTQRLATASPSRDGKQTPMKGHPVFIAQHATATCCRTCLSKWHGIEPGRSLSEQEIAHVVTVIMDWIETEMEGRWDPKDKDPTGRSRQMSLFEHVMKHKTCK
ncbi:MAG: DUF4186 domain-containing protein [Deltaproteobacteria bacterium]|nr:DUF4186 domain-containing protein [Deltaproteobacteria bacterium]